MKEEQDSCQEDQQVNGQQEIIGGCITIVVAPAGQVEAENQLVPVISENCQKQEEVDCNNMWNDFLAGLNEADRTILTLLHEQVKTAEIAERLGKTQNYVSVRIHRLKKGTRRALAA